jgi:putative glycosyltransferase (TIGR04372 family)
MALREKWKYSIVKTLKGEYREGERLRLEIFSLLNVDSLSTEDRNLHPEWGQAVGHIGHAMALSTYLKEQGIKKNSIELDVVSEDWCHALAADVLQDNFEIRNRRSHDFIADLPQTWFHYDRIWGIREESRYIDFIELSETVYSGNAENKYGYFTLPRNYELKCQTYLESNSIELPDSYISLHLRSKQDSRDARYCSHRNYEGLIRNIASYGFPILIFGDSVFDFGFDISRYNVVDLRTDSQEPQSLIPFLISNSKGFISSQSGPACISWSLGVPTLTTNAVAPNWSFHAAGPKSFYLPKTWIDKDESVIPFRRVLHSFLGDWAWTSKDSTELQGNWLRENSPAELTAASDYFMRCLLGEGEEFTDLNRELDRLREGSRAFGSGKIVPTYFELQNNSFLG